MRLRVVALFTGALLVAAMPALAQPQQTYVAEAEARAFELSVRPPGEEEPEGLIIGATHAGVQSGGDQVCDEGDVACAFAEALLGFSGAAEASQPTGEPEAAEEGGTFPVEELLVARFGVAEAAASAEAEPGGQSRAGATEIDVTLTETLFDEDALGPVKDEVKEGIDELLDPISENDPSGEIGPRLKGLVDFLFDNLGNAPLARIEVGQTTSATSHADGITTARATAQGTTVTLAPAPPGTELAELAPNGLAQVRIGDSAVAVSSDAETGSVDEARGAVVSLHLFDPGTQEYQEVPIEGGGECIEELDPLIICVAVGAATDEVEEDAGAFARVVGGVEVILFDGETLPQFTLSSALSVARVNAAVPEPEPEEPEPAPDLPRTGGNYLLPALVLLGAGSLTAGAAVRRRRR